MTDKIRYVTDDDVSKILNIYKYYIENTVITFEKEVPCVDEFRDRIREISTTFPYLVYVINHKVVGYAYASRHGIRAAFDWSVDVSIYIHKDYLNRGIGGKLYKELLGIVKELGYYNAYAAIALPNEASVKIHEAFGFKYESTFHKIGFKFGKWIDLGWWVLRLQKKYDIPIEPISIATYKK